MTQLSEEILDILLGKQTSKGICCFSFSNFNTKAIVLGFLISKHRGEGTRGRKMMRSSPSHYVSSFYLYSPIHAAANYCYGYCAYCSGFRCGYRLLDLVCFPVALELVMATWIHLFLGANPGNGMWGRQPPQGP